MKVILVGLKLTFGGEGIKIWWRESTEGKEFSRWEGIREFLVGGGDSLPSPLSRENPVSGLNKPAFSSYLFGRLGFCLSVFGFSCFYISGF